MSGSNSQSETVTSCQDTDGLWHEDQAANFLKISIRTLQGWRRTGNGPQFVRMGYKSIRYRREDLQAFVAARIKLAATQNEGGAIDA